MRRTTPDILGDVLAAEPGENRLEIRRQLRWDYGQVSPVHRKTVEDAAIDVAIAGRRMAASTMQVGEALRRVKGLLDHGQFSDWCEIEFGMNIRTAQRMMSVAENLGDKSDKLSHLGSSVLYLLGADSTPEVVREAVIEEAAQTGKAPAVAEVKRAIAAVRGGSAADVAQPAAVVEERQADGDDRLSRLKRWWVRLMAMQNDLLDWGDLTGRHLATGEVERGLRKMLEITQRELDLLEGREVEEVTA